jgi:replicative DNA helicase
MSKGALAALSRRASFAEVVTLAPPTIAGRVPPHDLDAEAAVLSAILLSRDALDRVLEILKPEHFYSEANGRIYMGAQELASQGIPIDIVSVASWLRDREWLAHIGGPSYLAQLADATPAAGHVEAHAAIVRDKWRVRQMISMCQVIAAEGYGDYGQTQEYLDGAALAIDLIARETAKSLDVEIGTAAEAALAEIDEAMRASGTNGLSTGLRDLDHLFGGLRNGGVTVAGGRTSMGKTAFARHVAHHVATTHEPDFGPDGRARKDECGRVKTRRIGALVLSLESRRNELALDFIYTLAGVDSQVIKQRGFVTGDERDAMGQAAKYLKTLPLWIDDSPDLTAERLRSRIRQRMADCARKGIRLGLVVVDYLQLMTTSKTIRKGAGREEAVAYNSRAIKLMAMEFGLHILSLSQLNRELESRSIKNKRPRMSDLRESGATENDADNIILLFRPEYYDPKEKPRIAELIVEKQRRGRRCVTIEVGFDARYTRFYDIDRHEDDGRWAQ